METKRRILTWLVCIGTIIFAFGFIAKAILMNTIPTFTIQDGVMYCCTNPEWMRIVDYIILGSIIIAAVSAVLDWILRIRARANRTTSST